MEIGIFSKTFRRLSLAETLDAVRLHGFSHIQFNMACAGLESMPAMFDEETAHIVRREAILRDIEIDAVSGTFNMSHPNPVVREQGLARLDILARMCLRLGVLTITIGSGSRDRNDMWSPHKDNGSVQAWNDMLRCLERAITTAESYGLTLALEPEAANVVNDAPAARKVLDTMKSRNLKIVFDAANLVVGHTASSWSSILRKGVELLGEDIVLAHAKDIRAEDDSAFVAVGKGELEFDFISSLLREASYPGPLIMHGLEEQEAAESFIFLQRKLMDPNSKSV